MALLLITLYCLSCVVFQEHGQSLLMISLSSLGRTLGPKARRSRGHESASEGSPDLTHTSTSWRTELRSSLPFPTLRIKTLMYSKDISGTRLLFVIKWWFGLFSFLYSFSIWICVPHLCWLNLDQALEPHRAFFFLSFFSPLHPRSCLSFTQAQQTSSLARVVLGSLIHQLLNLNFSTPQSFLLWIPPLSFFHRTVEMQSFDCILF